MPKSTATSTAQSSPSSAARYDPTALVQGRIAEIHTRTTRWEAEELALKRKLVPRLAQRAYHLEEGNSWWTDWVQYQKNTHPVFGLCLYHRYHPIRLPQRIIILVGSIACGFAITNFFYLGFLEDVSNELGLESAYNVTGTVTENVVSAIHQRYAQIELTENMIYLITIGSCIHSLFDMVIWYLMACFCFRPGGCRYSANDAVIDERDKTDKRCQTVGVYIAVLFVQIAIGVATYFVLLRLDEDIQNQADYEATNAEEFAEEIIGEARFAFFVGYALELVFALFIFYFITSTVFFTGILGCGRLPVLGGRPYELWKEKIMIQNDVHRTSVDGNDPRGLRPSGV